VKRQTWDVGRRPDLQVRRVARLSLMSWPFGVISGLLLTVSFPPFSLVPAMGVALLPLLHAAAGRSWRDAFRLGLLAGVVHFGTLLWWIAPTVATYGNLAWWAAWPVLGLLVIYLGLYVGVWSGLVGRLAARTSDASFSLAASGLWVLLEWGRGHLLGGFPWGSLAYALDSFPAFIQTAEFWGPYGVSFLIVLLNCLMWRMIPRQGGREESGSGDERCRRAVLGLFLAAAVCAVWGFGKWRAEHTARGDDLFPPLRVLAVQGAVPQDLKWDPAFQRATLERYRRLTVEGMELFFGTAGSLRDVDMPVLTVWPETAAPFYFQHPGPLRQAVQAVARDLDTFLLFGSPSYGEGESKDAYYNSAYLVAPTGVVVGRYDKIHLVPFGEYVPWRWALDWTSRYLPTAGEFQGGTSSSPLSWQGLHVGVLICFESIFPALSRKTVDKGAGLLAVITNDAWFGRTGAPFQHEAMAVFRAVETRRWVVRAANTGVSAVISPWGERVARSPLFESCSLGATAHLREGRTLYASWGEHWFIVFCLAAAAYPLWVSRRSRKKD